MTKMFLARSFQMAPPIILIASLSTLFPHVSGTSLSLLYGQSPEVSKLHLGAAATTFSSSQQTIGIPKIKPQCLSLMKLLTYPMTSF